MTPEMHDVFEGGAWLDGDGECVNIQEDGTDFAVIVTHPGLPEKYELFRADDKATITAFLLGRFETLTPKWKG